MRCSGISRCEHLCNELRDITHTDVTEETWTTITQKRGLIDSTESDPLKRDASMYAAPFYATPFNYFSNNLYYHTASSFRHKGDSRMVRPARINKRAVNFRCLA